MKLKILFLIMPFIASANALESHTERTYRYELFGLEYPISMKANDPSCFNNNYNGFCSMELFEQAMRNFCGPYLTSDSGGLGSYSYYAGRYKGPGTSGLNYRKAAQTYVDYSTAIEEISAEHSRLNGEYSGIDNGLLNAIKSQLSSNQSDVTEKIWRMADQIDELEQAKIEISKTLSDIETREVSSDASDLSIVKSQQNIDDINTHLKSLDSEAWEVISNSVVYSKTGGRNIHVEKALKLWSRVGQSITAKCSDFETSFKQRNPDEWRMWVVNEGLLSDSVPPGERVYEKVTLSQSSIDQGINRAGNQYGEGTSDGLRALVDEGAVSFTLQDERSATGLTSGDLYRGVTPGGAEFSRDEFMEFLISEGLSAAEIRRLLDLYDKEFGSDSESE
ncbi:hypothetical protein [Ferrimonas marina]|uniref:Uncharacterized protein n=1 Tax=Ferrimonas marina TaxID=299255 RepID=A0A1M5THG8_9GAMM|nr:hypothetical protein [Ferrimonas marina]SHH49803.1 hypothetical protein SAMN02745129_2135 [Ferrimonas marina]